MPVEPDTPLQGKEDMSSGSNFEEYKTKSNLISPKEEETKVRIGGFFSSMFKKSDKAPKVVTPSPTNSMNNIKFQFIDNSQNDSKQKTEPIQPIQMTGKKSLHRKESNLDTGGNSKISRQAFKDDMTEKKQDDIFKMSQVIQLQNETNNISDIKLKDKKVTKRKSDTSNLLLCTEIENDVQNEDLKKDLIHVMITAVEQNWLNQAPKPTLDKVKALQALDSDPELENSERSTSEADYIKKKVKAQKSKDLISDDEGAQLCKQESGDGEFPYVETTLPEERKGVVTITPSNQRVSECRLTSIDRPRSSSPRKQGRLEEYFQEQDKNCTARKESQDKITIKLPKQESKNKVLMQKTENESWDTFSVAVSQNQQKTTAKKIEICQTQTNNEKHDWVDCEKLPETKKTVKRYCTEVGKQKITGTNESLLQTLSGTHIVSPEECSCDCHHDTLSQIISPTSVDLKPVKYFGLGGTKPKPNPRTSSVSSRTKPIPSLKSKESVGTRSSHTNNKKSSGPPPVPIRTTSFTKTTNDRYFKI